MKADELINNVRMPKWNKEDFMKKFYPTAPAVLKKETPKVTGFTWSFKLPSSLTAPEIVDIVKREDIKIKKPLFDIKKKKSLFKRFMK